MADTCRENLLITSPNLSNEFFGFYFGSPQYFYQREYYQPTVAAGFRGSPTHEK